MHLLKKKYKKLTKSEETQLLTCTFMVPAGSSVMLERVIAVHSDHVIAYPDDDMYTEPMFNTTQLCFMLIKSLF